MPTLKNTRTILTWLLLLYISSLHAQDSTGSTSPFVTRIRQFGKEEARISADRYKEGQILARQYQQLGALLKEAQHARIYLKGGIDSNQVKEALAMIRRSAEVVKDGIITNKGSFQTQRNLTISSVILGQLLHEIAEQQEVVGKHTAILFSFRNKIDSLEADPALVTFPSDSVAIMRYVKKLASLQKEISPADSAVDRALLSTQELQMEVDRLAYELRSAYEEIQLEREQTAASAFKQEVPGIVGPVLYSRPFKEIVDFSAAKEWLALKFYLNNNISLVIILFILILLSVVFLQTLKKRLNQQDMTEPDLEQQLVIRRPWATAVLLIVSCCQFIFIDAPFAFSFSLWLVSSICLGVVFYGYISPYWMRFWAAIVFLFAIACLDNLLLQASRTERWIMLGISLSGILYGIWQFAGKRRLELQEKRILLFIGFMVVCETVATILNLAGRYNLSKTMMITGFTGVVIAILFLWTIRLINDGLKLVSMIFQHPERQLLYINFNKVGARAPLLLYVLLIVAWFILVARNFYGFRQVTVPFNAFLNQERSVGDYTFTIYGIFIFMIVAGCSLLLSRLISFFTYEPGTLSIQHGNKGRLKVGSWLLLIRIFIICGGLFLAFAASGIPLDRLTIVLGALGVGVGLGLQGLVNNLVSGLIIAFEKPVNVGDFVEVSGQAGTVKTIGFRSSTIALTEGACLVIPNGDLLSQHLVNWSMAKNTKRVHVNVGVAYGSDLEKVRSRLLSLLQDDNRILTFPEPFVTAKNFGDSAVSFEIICWVKHFSLAANLTSDLIIRINNDFKEAGIVIPFPQQDIRVIQEKKEEQQNND